MKSYRFFTVLVLCGLLLVLSQNNLVAAESAKYELRWGTIVAGGAWQVIGAAMLEDVKKMNPNIIGSTGPSTPTTSLVSVHQGKLNIAFSLSDATAEAWEGEGYFKPFGKIQDIRNLMTIYPQATHIVVAADSNINKIEDLKGKRISPGAKGLSNDIESQRLFALYGLSYKDFKVSFLSFEDAAQQFTDGHIDALTFVTLPFPFASIINVSSKRQIKLLSIPDDKIAALAKFRGVEPYTIPAGTYSSINYPVKGIASRAHIFVRQDFPEDTAYAVVKSIMANFKRYPTVYKSMDLVKENDIGRDIGIPFHPGAIKYLKEKGLVK
jgi:TRAP transporter TAXI family solute receptor